MSENRGRNRTNVRRTRPSLGLVLLSVVLVGLAIGFAVWSVASIPKPYREMTPAPTPQPAGGEQDQAAAGPIPPEDLVHFPDLSNPFGRHYLFRIDPKTPVKDLLPEPPKARGDGRPVTVDDLARVPEVSFQEPIKNEPDKPAPEDGSPPLLESDRQEALIAYQTAKINVLNFQKFDSFLAELRATRPDLDGLPFTTGEPGRSDGKRNKQFIRELGRLRLAQLSAHPELDEDGLANNVRRPMHERFWARYQPKDARDAGESPVRIAALMQILAVEPSDLQPGLVSYLAGVNSVEATRALAQIAIYSTEDKIRHAAVEALIDRREADYAGVLLQGMRYPWPAVARRAAEALVKLDRSELVPQLVDLLDEPDPRAPVLREMGGKQVAVARELVRINHHRNCLLCHPPGNLNADPSTPTAPVPLPCKPLPSFLGDYARGMAEVLIRFDVTYLRQDFSVYQPVADANPWPEMQRFDFLVRMLPLNDEEAKAFREAFAKQDPGQPSPYQSAALIALRGLTGKDAAPTAESWRRLLNLPARPKSAAP
jgi:hypothetical protein